MRATFQFFPGCFGQGKRESSQRRLVNCGAIPRKHKTCPDSQISSNSTSVHFYRNGEREDPTPCHSLSDYDEKKKEITNASLEAHPGGGHLSKLGVFHPQSHRHDGINLGNRIGHNCIVHASVKENGVVKKPPDGRDDSINLRAAEVALERSTVHADDSESLTCQRVREYIGKIKNSCARTDKIWPFERSGPTLNPHEASLDSSIGAVGPLRGQNDASVTANKTNSYSPNNKIECTCPKAPPGTQEEECAKCSRLIEQSDKTGPVMPPRKAEFRIQSVPSPVLLLSSQHKRVPAPGLEVPENVCQDSQMLGWSSLSSAPQNTSESPGSIRAVVLFPGGSSDEEQFLDRSPAEHVSYDTANTSAHGKDACTETSPLLYRTSKERPDKGLPALMIPPVISPVYSLQRNLFQRTVLYRSSSSSDGEDVREIISGQNGVLSPHHVPQTVRDEVNTSPREVTARSSCNRVKIRLSEEQTDHKRTESDSLNMNLKTSLSLGALTDSDSSSCDGHADEVLGDCGMPRSSKDESSDSETVKCDEDGAPAQAAESSPGTFDEIMAYEHDVLLVNVTKDDPELFQNLPQQSLLKLGPVREPKETTRVNSKRVSFKANYHLDSLESTEMDDNISRPWRPQSFCTSIKKKQIKCPTPDYQNKPAQMRSDSNNNNFPGGIKSSQRLQTMSSTHKLPLVSLETCLPASNSANTVNFRNQKSNSYCRHYFSETRNCELKSCRYQHLPLNGDEKFCIETVARFSKIPACLHKARAVYAGYYKDNVPGVYFCKPVFQALLWALLKAGMVQDVFLILSVNLAHRTVPSHEFLLTLFRHVREKSLMSLSLELLQLTFKMVNADLDLSLDCLDCMKDVPKFQQMLHSGPLVPAFSAAGNCKFTSSAASQEHLSLATSLVEVELCIKQEDWKHMGEVYSSVHWLNHHPKVLEHVSSRIAITLLADGKDRLALPFAVFVEAACQNTSKDSVIRTFAGRIGVSLISRYHKTNQLAKGRVVVELLSSSQVSYSTIKSLFANEEAMSRCCLITVAAEFFLQSGSVEGALKTLRENNWFLSSSLWPCKPVDLEHRTRVLVSLSEQTSQRDSFEVLSNLPGLKESDDSVDTSRYHSLFNSHLQMCVKRQTLPVAADTVDFMFCKQLPVNHALLQVLLHKLGKQKMWVKARQIFRDSMRGGYYSGVTAPPGSSALRVPCHLCEVELALAFEMFISVNSTAAKAAASPLLITLRRTQNDESKYLSAGSHILAAAGILQPKVVINYTTVNPSQEQVFRVEKASAQRWLSYNHSWAAQLWTH